jgi:hypothetical protein
MLANPEHEAAVKLTEKIKAKKLPTPFTVRQVQRKGWEGLGDNAVIKEAMPILIESNWVLEVEKPYTGNGRKPAPNYHINPEAYAEGGYPPY